MNLIDFMRESAAFLSKDRPDVYPTEEVALSELSRLMDMIADGDQGWVSFTSYVLFRHEEDGVTDWELTRKLSSCTLFQPEGECLVLSYTHGSGTMKYGIDLPAPGLD